MIERDLSTTETARLLHISRNTVIRLCDSGSLPHYHMPNSSWRRIRRADLEKFAAKHGITLADQPQVY